MTAPLELGHDLTIHVGQALDVLRTLPDAAADCIVTSPPYYGLRDYGVDGQLGLEPSPGEYVAAMRAVFADVRRVLAGDGVLWLNLGDSYSGGLRSTYDTNGGKTRARGHAESRPQTGVPEKNLLGIPWRVAFALQDDGWTLRNAVIWHKPNAMPESVTDRLSTRYEHVFLFSKSRRYWFDLDPIREPNITAERKGLRTSYPAGSASGSIGADGVSPHHREGAAGLPLNDLGRNPGDVWAIATSPYPGAHFAVMPVALARRCIAAGCKPGGTVLDPFAGAGTTLLAARQLGRRGIGIELNPEYVDLAVERIGQPVLEFAEEAG